MNVLKTTVSTLVAASATGFAGHASAVVILNEIHYDNEGTDTGEFLEIVTTAGEDASMITVDLYNGNGGTSYASTLLSDLTSTLGTDGNTYYVWSPSSIQNGSPDGFAVSDADGLIEFLSYEGTFTGSGGAADGVLSVDIDVFEPGTTAIGSSLQRVSFGSDWILTEGTNTAGAVNVPEPASLALVALGGVALMGRRRTA